MAFKETQFSGSIASRDDFVAFLEWLKADFKREKWDNDDLRSYLSAMGRFAMDIDGHYIHMKKQVDLEKPTWQTFADILIAARVYD